MRIRLYLQQPVELTASRNLFAVYAIDYVHRLQFRRVTCDSVHCGAIHVRLIGVTREGRDVPVTDPDKLRRFWRRIVPFEYVLKFDKLTSRLLFVRKRFFEFHNMTVQTFEIVPN